MSKFMLKASYNPDGVRGLIKEGGSKRRAVVQKMIEGMGGKLEAFYYAWGADDAFIIADLPDEKAGIALSLSCQRVRCCSPDDDSSDHSGGDRRRGEEDGEIQSAWSVSWLVVSGLVVSGWWEFRRGES